MNNDTVQQLFTNLSKRLDSENNLSDITWAMCETSPAFKRLFIEFIFKKDFGNAHDIILEREYHDNTCRPDFRFTHDALEYIIEVKINDRNDHFRQYKTNFPDAKMGWIANYSLEAPKDLEIEIRSWNDYYESLLQHLQDTSHQDDISLIRGYCSYLKSVCLIIKMQKMSFNEMSSLLTFNKTVKKLVDVKINGLICEVDKGADAISKSRYGTFFSLRREGSKKNTEIYGWFGVAWDDTNTWIGVFFSQYYCPKIFNRVKDGPQFINTKISMKPSVNFKEFSHVLFKMSDEYYAEFHAKANHVEQEQLLSDFFHEVINSIAENIYHN